MQPTNRNSAMQMAICSRPGGPGGVFGPWLPRQPGPLSGPSTGSSLRRPPPTGGPSAAPPESLRLDVEVERKLANLKKATGFLGKVESETRDKQAPFTVTTLPLALNSTGVFLSHSPNDVELAFDLGGGTSSALWASSELLSSASVYYKDKFEWDKQKSDKAATQVQTRQASKRKATEMDESACPPADKANATEQAEASSEASEGEEDNADGDSDAEADGIYRKHSKTSGKSQQSSSTADRPHKDIQVTHAKYATYLAFLSWIQTGRIVFAPLKSSFTDPAARANLLWEAFSKHPHQPIPVSPKSMYKLANYLDVPELAKLALDAYLKLIDLAHAADEAFGPMLAHREVKGRMVEFLQANKGEVRRLGQFKEVRKKRKRGELGGREDDVIDVLTKLA